MIFCEIDKALTDILKSESKGKTIIDCGAGEGLLGSLMNNVIGLDIFPPEKPLSRIHLINCVNFPFTDKQLPIFIRPCHSDFVMATIMNNLFNKFIYVSKPKNLGKDLNCFISDYYNKSIANWKGKENERCYIFTKIGYVESETTDTYHLAKLPHWKKPLWLKEDSGMLRNPLGGGFPMDCEDVEIFETRQATDFPE